MGAHCVQQRAGVPETVPRKLGQNGAVAKTYGFCSKRGMSAMGYGYRGCMGYGMNFVPGSKKV